MDNKVVGGASCLEPQGSDPETAILHLAVTPGATGRGVGSRERK